MKKIILIIVGLVLFAGCSNIMGRIDRAKEIAPAAPEPGSISKSYMEEDAMPADEVQATMGNDPAVLLTRKVIYTAEMKIEVKEYDSGENAIRKMVADAGGFVADSSVGVDSDAVKSGRIVIRVPASKFSEVMRGLGEVGKVKYVAEHGADVTEEYADLEVRLANSKVMERRLLDLLEKKTNNVKDLLDVERELGRVRQEIEQMEGRKRFLDDRLTLSTITIDLFEPYTYTASVFDPVKEAFSSAGELLMRSVGALITFLAVVIPWLIVCGFFVWIVIKIIKRVFRRRPKEIRTDDNMSA